MPNRIIKETIRGSDTLARVSADAERLFWRLVVSADDFGRFDARPTIILGQCLSAFITEITTRQVETWLDELEKARLITRYTVESKEYLLLTKWDKHQQRRAKTSKFPQPTSLDIACKQMIANVPVFENVFGNVIENENGNENEDENENDLTQALNEVAASSETKDMNLSSSLEFKFPNSYQKYQHSGFGTIDFTVQQKIDGLCEFFTEEWFVEAVDEAVMQNKRSLSYVNRILQNWRAEGGIRRSGGERSEYQRRSGTDRSDGPPTRKRIVDTPGAY